MLCAAMLTFFLLGDSSPPPAVVGNWILTLCAIAGPVTGVLALIVAARRQPPMGEELHRDFAKGSDLKEFTRESRETTNGIYKRIQDLDNAVRNNQQDADRARGRMEGKIELLCKRFGIHSKHEDEQD